MKEGYVMTNRLILYATAMVVALTWSWAIAAQELTVPSEQQPSFARSRYVKPIDDNILSRYRHEQIRYVITHPLATDRLD